MQKNIQIQISPSEAKDEDSIKNYLFKNKLLKPNEYFKINKQSIDARKKQIKINLTLAISENPFPVFDFTPHFFQKSQNKQNIHIIGSGPAGIFAALEAILLGFRPIVIEQGKKISDRRRDLVKIIREGRVSETSNYCFGEGGAGTYSDGKLYTRSNKRGNVRKVLELLVQHGAKESILNQAHPHIGTNKLPQIIESMRNTILNNGGEFYFETQLVDLQITNHTIDSLIIHDLKTNKTNQIKTENVVLATGHSGRGVFELLHKKNIKIEAKPFAMGVRIEHPQELIDSIQYHCKSEEVWSIRENLPASSYQLVTQANGRGVYSFCMCPGGIIAPCATKNGEIVTNGWSPSKRNNPFANSGIVVETKQEDWQEFEAFGPLQALKFQESIEKKMYNSKQPQFAPAQRMIDFINNKNSLTLPKCSYHPGIYLAPLHEMLPKFMATSLQIGLANFGKKMQNYLTNEAVLVGIESRTSSPVRILRDKEKLQHTEIKNLYPCGEGAGFAGGIVSAAIDGQRCVRAIAEGKN